MFYAGRLHTHLFPFCAQCGFNLVLMAFSSTALYTEVYVFVFRVIGITGRITC